MNTISRLYFDRYSDGRVGGVLEIIVRGMEFLHSDPSCIIAPLAMGSRGKNTVRPRIGGWSIKSRNQVEAAVVEYPSLCVCLARSPSPTDLGNPVAMIFMIERGPEFAELSLLIPARMKDRDIGVYMRSISTTISAKYGYVRDMESPHLVVEQATPTPYEMKIGIGNLAYSVRQQVRGLFATMILSDVHMSRASGKVPDFVIIEEMRCADGTSVWMLRIPDTHWPLSAESRDAMELWLGPLLPGPPVANK